MTVVNKEISFLVAAALPPQWVIVVWKANRDSFVWVVVCSCL